jgi:hypothetical protein
MTMGPAEHHAWPCAAAVNAADDPAGQPGDAAERIEITRGDLAVFLTGLRVGVEQAEEWKMGPTAIIARPDRVAGMIAGHAAALRADEARADPELAAMAALLPVLPLVSRLGPDARERVMDWARRRAADRQPPF